MTIIERLINFYTNLSYQSMPQISSVYARDIVFTDPVSTFHGLPKLADYFENLLSNSDICHFEFTHTEQNTDSLHIHWVMTVRHPKLNKGNQYTVDGISFMKIENDLICYQRDYYDMGELMYEQLPLIKSLVKYIKKAMES